MVKSLIYVLGAITCGLVSAFCAYQASVVQAGNDVPLLYLIGASMWMVASLAGVQSAAFFLLIFAESR